MEVREKFVSRRDAAILALICAILGGVLSWIAFSSPDGIRVPKESGNAADWIAAFAGIAAAGGTWAIGRGANRYAKEAHLQRLSEHTQAQRDALEAKIRRFNVILLKVKRATHLDQVQMHDVPPGHSGPINLPSVISLYEALGHVLGTLRWPAEEIVLLNAPSQKRLDGLVGNVLALEAMLQAMRPFGKVNDQFRANLNAVASISLRIHRDATRLEARLAERIAELSADLITLDVRLLELNASGLHD